MGRDAFDAAFRRGRELSPDDVVRYALGEKLGRGRRPRSPAASARLTPRERQVAELVATGLSNRQIAMRLVIAQRTAESHIEHVLAKLGFTSRAQIAAWAAREPGA